MPKPGFVKKRREFAVSLLFCTVSIMLATSEIALAHVDEGWDWHLVDGKPKTKITWGFIGDDWPDYMKAGIREAAKEWNNAGTGWQFEELLEMPPNPQIYLRWEDITNPAVFIAQPDKEGRVNRADIVFDSKRPPKSPWGTKEKNEIDPKMAAKHEFGHALRLDHDPKKEAIMNEKAKVGEHNPTLTQDDINQAKESFTKRGIKQAKKKVAPDGEKIENFSVTILIPPGALAATTEITIWPQSDLVMPNPLAVPTEIAAVVTAVGFYANVTDFLLPVTVTLPYTEAIINGSFIVGELEGFKPPALVESSLQGFFFNETFQRWDPVSGSTVNMTAKTVTFNTTYPGMFGIGGPPSPDTNPPFVSITTPTNGSTVQNGVWINVTATDNVGVQYVEFYVDGTLQLQLVPEPYFFYLDTTTMVNGPHVVTVKAYDTSAPANDESATIFIDVQNVHDVAVTNVVNPKTVVCQGYTTNINVTAANQGDHTETFNVTLYVNTITIATQTITLASLNSGAIIFTWNTTGFGKGSYAISAYAWPVLSETDITDNTFTSSFLVRVSMVGDITGLGGVPDGKVDIKDLATAARAYGAFGPNYAFPGSPPSQGWNPNADINNDNKIDIKDLATIAKHFGEIDP